MADGPPIPPQRDYPPKVYMRDNDRYPRLSHHYDKIYIMTMDFKHITTKKLYKKVFPRHLLFFPEKHKCS